MSGFSTTVQQPLLATPRVIVNHDAAGGTAGRYFVAYPAKTILSGALTANTLSTALSLNGPGVLKVAAVQCQDATARTLRLQVTLDGTVVFDATSASIYKSGSGIFAVGFPVDTTSGTAEASTGFEAISFKYSCVIKIASSVSETNKIALIAAYHTN